MIFVTVGTQLPFKRLISAIDEWSQTNQEHKVVIQSCEDGFMSEHCVIKNHIEPDEWNELLQAADFVIAHAGMGTILNCIDNNKPLIIMPREYKYGEHRNDHQLATASKLGNIPGIYVSTTKESLFRNIRHLIDVRSDNKKEVVNSSNLNMLISELKKFADLDK